jgi:serine/threonine protein kinase
MGVVYQCSQPELDRLVAVKVMIAGRHASAEQILRFQREAWAAAQLIHPNIVQVYDVGADGELHYIVMEYVDGWPLDRLIGAGALSREQTLQVVAEVALALQAAHARGIIHRDIKPANILVHRSGQPKLSDFGLAKALGSGQNLSGSGALIGTPRYMSPEQVLAPPEDIDTRTDIYSLGAVLYEMLTGQPPVDGDNVLTILRKLSDEEPVPVRARCPDVPEAVATICTRAMAREKAARYPSAAALAADIHSCLGSGLSTAPLAITTTQQRWRPRLVRRVVGVAALLLLGLSVLVGWTSRSASPDASPNPPSDAPAADDLADEELAAPAIPEVVKPPRRTAQSEGNRVKEVVALARQMSTSPRFAGTETPRERWKTLLEQLTSVVLLYPDHHEARFLRGHVHRQAGQYLSAIDDFNRMLRPEVKDLRAITERLLANYQLHILYLGSFNEPLLRPDRNDRVSEDVKVLLREGDATQKYLAQMVQALAQRQYDKAAALVEKRPSGAATRADDVADVALVEADALLRQVDRAYEVAVNAPEKEKEKEQKRHDQLVRLANAALRRGLDANPNHVGLLFLKADTFQRVAVWGSSENEDRGAMLRRQRVAFDTALDRLRNATSVGDGETALGWAVLLNNFGRDQQAQERINDALKVPYAHTLRAWMRLVAPAEGPLSAADVNRILQDFEPAFETPPEDFNTYFVRALLRTAAARWDDARADLRDCRKRLAGAPLPTTDDTYTKWLERADNRQPQDTRFLDATLNVLWYLAVPEDLRIGLADQLLRRLTDAGIIAQEKLTPADVKSFTGWTHFRLAKSYAGKNDKPEVLRHIRAALALKLDGLRPADFRAEQAFNGWTEDADFVKLYKEYE